MVGDDMNIIVIILLIIALIASILIIFIINYNKFQWTNIKVNKGEINILSLLEKKHEIILRYYSLLNENIKINEKDFTGIDNINNEDIIIFNKELDNITNTINKYLDNNEKILKNENIKNINKELDNINITLNGCKKYYNDNLINYNKLCKTFPSIIISKIFKYKEKDFIEENIDDSLKILNEE